MICLVWGPSASGKSAWAEARACGLARCAAGGWEAQQAASTNGVRPVPDETETAAPARLAYFATMQRGGREAQARIEKHLAQRAGKEFVTYETPVLSALADALVDASTTVLSTIWATLWPTRCSARRPRTQAPRSLPGAYAQACWGSPGACAISWWWPTPWARPAGGAAVPPLGGSSAVRPAVACLRTPQTRSWRCAGASRKR